MAGRPRTRAKREAQARVKKRFDPVARDAVLKRAEEVGTAAAAAEAGVPSATVRTWRKRRADAPVPAVVSVPGEPVGDVEGVVSGSRTERLRARAEKARQAQHRAEDRADAMIGQGQAAESRNATVTGAAFAERAVELEAAADAAELHEAALSEAEGALLLGVLDRVFAAIDVAVPQEVVSAALVGEVPSEVAGVAREEVRRRLRAGVEAEIEQKRFVSRHSPPEPDVDLEREESEPPDAEPSPAAVEEEGERQRDPEYVPAGNRTSGWKKGGVPRAPGGRFSEFQHPGLRGM